MPNILKSIFKHGRGDGPREVSRSVSPVETSPTTYSNLRLQELEALADRLAVSQRGEAPGPGGLDSLLRRLRNRGAGEDASQDATMKRFLEAFERVEDDRRAGRVSPFSTRPESSTSRSLQRIPSPRERDSMLGMALQVCEAAIARGEQMLASPLGEGLTSDSLRQCVDILEAQREEILDLLLFAPKVKSANIHALMQKYVQFEAGLSQLRGMSGVSALPIVMELNQELEEGPDYLIDVAIIEVIIWHGEVIDPSLGAEMREILRGAIADRATDAAIFRYAAESIAAAADRVPADVLDDEMSRDARNVIFTLLKQLDRRVASSVPPSGTTSPRSSVSAGTLADQLDHVDSGPNPTARIGPPHTRAVPATKPAISSASSSPSGSRASTPSLAGELQHLGVDDLQKRFGTGTRSPAVATPDPSGSPSPAPNITRPTESSQSSYQPAASSRGPASSATPQPDDGEVSTPSSEKSIFEYEGNLLTRSALDLVLAHKRLGMADSSGQYNGEVSWDDIRSAWIPKWVEKLNMEDVAEGEVPSTNPADFKTKKKDAWGNKIGWWEGKMFYEDEPTFE